VEPRKKKRTKELYFQMLFRFVENYFSNVHRTLFHKFSVRELLCLAMLHATKKTKSCQTLCFSDLDVYAMAFIVPVSEEKLTRCFETKSHLCLNISHTAIDPPSPKYCSSLPCHTLHSMSIYRCFLALTYSARPTVHIYTIP
jgi:hypothetical protein